MGYFQKIFLYFIIYSFFGWLFEVAYAYTHQGKFVNRGFLHGPFCPLYGFSSVIIITLLNPFKHNFILLFVMSTILTSVIEYVTGFLLEKVFNQKWWDYTEDPFNLHGRICLLFSLMWGVACVLIIKIVQPIFAALLSFISYKMMIYVCIGFAVYFLIDGVTTLLKLANIDLSSKFDFNKFA